MPLLRRHRFHRSAVEGSMVSGHLTQVATRPVSNHVAKFAAWVDVKPGGLIIEILVVRMVMRLA